MKVVARSWLAQLTDGLGSVAATAGGWLAAARWCAPAAAVDRWAIPASGRPCQLLQPVAAQLLEHFSLQSFPLPDRKIGVLDRQLPQRRRQSRRKSAVSRQQLASEHRQRPAVVNDVVQANQHHVLLFAEPQQFQPRQGPSARSIGCCD